MFNFLLQLSRRVVHVKGTEAKKTPWPNRIEGAFKAEVALEHTTVAISAEAGRDEQPTVFKKRAREDQRSRNGRFEESLGQGEIRKGFFYSDRPIV